VGPDQLDEKALRKIVAVPAAVSFSSHFRLARNQHYAGGGFDPGCEDRRSWNYIVFSLPPLDEQKRIVEQVGELMKLCDELEAQLERAEANGARLFESIIAGLTAA
jgi:hypothetical protein